MLNSQRVTVVKFTLLILAIAVVAYMAIKTPIRPVLEMNSAVAASDLSGATSASQSISSAQVAHQASNQDASPTSGPVSVIVYYFHMTARCERCIRLEEWTKEAVLNGFSDALKAGQLAWWAIDVEKSENDHFIDDYQLTDKSVVVAEFKGGKRVRYKVLDETWSLLDEKGAFLKYIRSEVREYLLGT
ncbi:MAG TPA: nitrophenyl compound nitroreductase subunit ArsF family protein [bacterium]|nr:nitrophenyl compound nitroreductase subunit ArsF family protein [bacterium]